MCLRLCRPHSTIPTWFAFAFVARPDPCTSDWHAVLASDTRLLAADRRHLAGPSMRHREGYRDPARTAAGAYPPAHAASFAAHLALGATHPRAPGQQPDGEDHQCSYLDQSGRAPVHARPLLAWQRERVRRIWTFETAAPQSQPSIAPKLAALILRLAGENPNGRSRRTFLAHYTDHIVTCAVFTAETAGLKPSFVLVGIELGRRRGHLTGCTATPTSTWVPGTRWVRHAI